MLLVIVLFASWYVFGPRPREGPVMRQVQIVRYTELGVPPSIASPERPKSTWPKPWPRQ